MLGLKVWTIFFLMMAFQGLFLAYLLFTKKNNLRNSNVYLGAFITVFSIVLIFWVAFWNDFHLKYAHFNFLYNPVPLLLGPFFYFCVRSSFQQFSFKKTFAHFIPFLVTILYLMPFYILSASEKIELLQNNALDKVLWQKDALENILFISDKVSYIFYTARSFLFIKRHRSANIGVVKTMISFFALLSLLAILNAVLIKFLDKELLIIDVFVAAMISVLIYAIGYLGFSKRKSVFEENSPKYNSSALNPASVPRLIEQLKHTLESNKSYLQEDFKLSDLSRESGIPSHQISELLNQYHNENFSDFINKYRIEEALKLLKSKEYKNRTVSAIGFDVGFNSKTTFYTAFKKFTGLTPLAYQKKHLPS